MSGSVDGAVDAALASGKYANDTQIVQALEPQGHSPKIVRRILQSLRANNRVAEVGGRLQTRSSFEAIACPPDQRLTTRSQGKQGNSGTR